MVLDWLLGKIGSAEWAAAKNKICLAAAIRTVTPRAVPELTDTEFASWCAVELMKAVSASAPKSPRCREDDFVTALFSSVAATHFATLLGAGPKAADMTVLMVARNPIRAATLGDFYDEVMDTRRALQDRGADALLPISQAVSAWTESRGTAGYLRLVELFVVYREELDVAVSAVQIERKHRE